MRDCLQEPAKQMFSHLESFYKRDACLQGVPVRVEVSPKDVAQNACVTACRDLQSKCSAIF